MSVIHILPEAVANKIAAGEVVERPASVVKELLENSLDAGANRVELALEAGGKRLIRVVDDGCGMGRDDALLAFERHATSKIRSAEDLIGIQTLGFRGEALPSIAAVSRLTLETRSDEEAAGTRVEIVGGKLRDASELACSRGTKVEARDLFFNTPARRKFLKSESTELGHIASLVTHYALAHPEKSFRLSSLTHQILNVTPVASRRERLYQVFGRQLLDQLVELAPVERRMTKSLATPEEGQEESPEAQPFVRLSGFASRPEVQKLNRNHIYFFVNRRLVRERLILHAITEAYYNILPKNVFPLALIFIELPPGEVDVNVHPSKTEVRFRNSGFIHDFVRDSIRQALVSAQPVAAFPQPKRAPGAVQDRQFARPPVLSPAIPPARRVNEEQNDFQLSTPTPTPETGSLPLEDARQAFVSPATGTAAAETPGAAEAGLGPSEFPSDLYPLGQVQQSFIVATNSEGLWIIDQHVAHERILFEHHVQLRREKRVEGQRLLLPIVVELKPAQQVTFQEIGEELSLNGFEVEPFGQRTVAIKTAPAEISTEAVERLLIEILDRVGEERSAVTLDNLRSKIAASVSCHAAIKVNMALERKKMEWLLRELAKTKCPMTCPHGRPVVLRYGLKEIQRAFKRI